MGASVGVIPFQPLGATVVVIPLPNPPQGGELVQLADVYHDAETSGTIIAIGSHFCCASCAAVRDTPYEIGERVTFNRGAGVEIDGAPFGLVGETFLLLQESELLAVVPATALCEVV